MQAKILEQLNLTLPDLQLRRDEPMRCHTSFRIGGPAAAMAFPSSRQELGQLLQLCVALGVQTRILGAGTNVLAPDAGLDALVICTKDCLLGLEALPDNRIFAQSGESLSRVAVFAREHGLAGLEFAHGIPGTVGGGIYMNAGAYGGELSQVVAATTVVLPDGAERTFTGAEQGFSYRHSVFETMPCVIAGAVFQLQPDDPAAISARMRELMAKRRTSQPLELPSAGSTFKRPAGGYAAALIDQAGLKGCGVGGAQVSEKHAGFVVNTGCATARDVLDTMQLVQERVLECSGVHLEPEVRIW